MLHALLLSTWLGAAAGPSVPVAIPALSPPVARLAAAVDPARLQADVARLAGFGTRHTLSDTTSPTRGIGAARRWLAESFLAAGQQPGARLRPFDDRFTQAPGPRLPRPTEIWNVGAVLPGVDDARRSEAVVLVAHYDSRAS